MLDYFPEILYSYLSARKHASDHYLDNCITNIIEVIGFKNKRGENYGIIKRRKTTDH